MNKLPRSATRSGIALAGLALVAALSGCVVAPPHRGYEPAPGPVVMMPPPQPQVEVYGAAPYPGAVWISGYWGWGGGRHSWVPGRWARAPQPGYRWVPHAWHGGDRGYHLRGGHWGR